MKRFHVNYSLILVLVFAVCVAIGCEKQQPEQKQDTSQGQEQKQKPEQEQGLKQDRESEQEPSPTEKPMLLGTTNPYGNAHSVNGRLQYVDRNGVYTTEIPECGTAYICCNYFAEPGSEQEERTIWVGIDNIMSVLPKNCVLRVQICTRANPTLFEPYYDKLDDNGLIFDFPIIRVWVEDKGGAVLNTYNKPLPCIVEMYVEESDIHRIVAINNEQDEQLEYVYEPRIIDNSYIQKAVRITLVHPCEAIAFIAGD